MDTDTVTTADNGGDCVKIVAINPLCTEPGEKMESSPDGGARSVVSTTQMRSFDTCVKTVRNVRQDIIVLIPSAYDGVSHVQRTIQNPFEKKIQSVRTVNWYVHRIP